MVVLQKLPVKAANLDEEDNSDNIDWKELSTPSAHLRSSQASSERKNTSQIQSSQISAPFTFKLSVRKSSPSTLSKINQKTVTKDNMTKTADSRKNMRRSTDRQSKSKLISPKKLHKNDLMEKRRFI